MSLFDGASAIDDSFGPVHFNLRPTGLGGQLHTSANAGYNGPRSGHWTVSGTVHGSAIDDRCPTLHCVQPGENGGSGRVQPLSGSVIRKLAKATEDEKKAKDEVFNLNAPKAAVGDAAKRTENAASKKPILPKGFYIPKVEKRGIRIASKDGKNEVVRQPQVTPVAAKPVPDAVQKSQDEERKGNERAPSPQPSAASQKAPSIVSQASQQSKKAVRIVSKSGEEVVMQLAIMQFGSKPASRPPSAGKKQEMPQKKEQTLKGVKAEKAQRDTNAAKAAKQLREERAFQTQIEEQQAMEAKISAEALMSGALPTPSRVSSVHSEVSARTVKASSRGSRVTAGATSQNSSQPPSWASSTTTIPAPQVAATVRSAKQKSQRAVSDQGNRSTPNGWKEVGSGILDAAPLQNVRRSTSNHSKQSSQATPVHSFGGWSASNQERSINGQNNCKHSPTVFAGRGWISPHPLSRAPSEFEPSPDRIINLPSRNGLQEGATMTYDEWRSIQQSGEVKGARRNVSRSSSGALEYAGGSWGFHAVRRAESMRSEVHSQAWRSRYESPKVESVHRNGSGATEHDFDGVREIDGKTQLRMPWDGEKTW